MSLEAPVLPTSIGGIPEIISKNRCGILTARASRDDIQRAIGEYFSGREFSRESDKSVVECFHRIFFIEKMASDYLEVFRKAFAGPVTEESGNSHLERKR
jgi:glycosyltransferase involved in cell wall biosynthesis